MKIFSNKGQWGCSFTPASYVTLRKLVNLLVSLGFVFQWWWVFLNKEDNYSLTGL